MEIFSAALPNIMFVAGIIAIAISLGIELKLVPIGNKVGRGGRIGAMTFGILLIGISVYLYIQGQGATIASTPTAIPASIQPTLPPAAQIAVSQPAVTLPDAPGIISIPTMTAAPSAAASPTSLPEPSAFTVPDVRGMRQKDAEKQFSSLGLHIEPFEGSCADLGVSDGLVQNAKKDTIACQLPAPGTQVTSGTTIKIVFADPKGKR